MSQLVRSRTVLFLLALGASFTVCAQTEHPDAPHAKLSVEPSGPGLFYGVGILDTDFRFSADVSDATRYILDFDDNVVVTCNLGEELACDEVDDVTCELDRSTDHKIACIHRYKRLENYTVKLQAFRGAEPVIPPLQLAVSIKSPPPVPEPIPSIVRFSAVLSDAMVHRDIEFPEADFTFTAFADDAESYELDFGDASNVTRNIAPEDIEPRSATSGIRHVYEQPGSYTARMKAWRNNGDWVENELLVVVQQPPPPDLFMVEPSDPESATGIGLPDTDFIFTADVSGALRYELDFDGDGVSDDKMEVGADGTGVRFSGRRYETPGSYTAKLTAWRAGGAPIENTVDVRVQVPPVVDPDPPQGDRPIWPWLLILAAIAILLGTFWIPSPVASGTGDVSFEPRVDLGRVRVVGSAKADDAVSMRVRRDAGRLLIRTNKGESQ